MARKDEFVEACKKREQTLQSEILEIKQQHTEKEEKMKEIHKVHVEEIKANHARLMEKTAT